MYSSVNKRILALCICCSCIAHAGLLLGIADKFKHPHFMAGRSLSVSLRQETAQIPSAPAPLINPGPEASGINPGLEATGINPGLEATGINPGLEATGINPGPEATGINPGPEATGINPGPEASEPAVTDIPPQPSTGLRQQLANDTSVAMMTTEDTAGDPQAYQSPIIHQAHSPSARQIPAPATVPPEISVQVRLHAMMSSYFSYPLLARQRNWQGEVRLGLRVEANGRLSHIHIVKSSGYTILDHAAQKSLEQVATIPDAADWLQGRHFDTVIPVEYRLIDS